MRTSISLLAACALVVSNLSSAFAVTTATSSTAIYVPPSQNGVTYSYNLAQVQATTNNQAGVFQVNCNVQPILAVFGISANADVNVTSITIDSGSLEYTVDVKNCSLSAYPINFSNTNNSITKTKALATIQDLLATSPIAKIINLPLGTAELQSVDSFQ